MINGIFGLKYPKKSNKDEKWMVVYRGIYAFSWISIASEHRSSMYNVHVHIYLVPCNLYSICIATRIYKNCRWKLLFFYSPFNILYRTTNRSISRINRIIHKRGKKYESLVADAHIHTNIHCRMPLRLKC